MDVNEFGEQYRKPLCLDCHWESKKGRIISRIIKALSKKRFVFVLHMGPETAYIRRQLTNRLNRVVKGHFATLEEVAFLIGGAKRKQEPRGPEYVTVQTNLVIATLRKFEEKRGSTRTKMTRQERLEMKREDERERRRVDPERMSSLEEPATMRAADWARYHELGGAKKRITSEEDPYWTGPEQVKR